jgi:nucleoside-diphosphate-sugar epimerase
MPTPSGSRAVLVTGGSGYIGSVLVPRLVARGHDTRVLDLRAPAGRAALKGSAAFLEGDVRDPAVIRPAVAGVDTVIHLAFLSSDRSTQVGVRAAHAANVGGLETVLAQAIAAGVGRFIFASSCSVYGHQAGPEEVDETARPDPLTPYARQKLACEQILLRQPGAPEIILLRASTVCGPSPRMRPELTFNRLIAEAWTQGRVTVANRDCVRPFVAIDDLASCYVRLVEAETLDPAHPVLNASGPALPMHEHAETVRRRVSALLRTPVARSEAVGVGDPRSYRVSSALIASRYGIAFPTTLSDLVDRLRPGEPALPSPRPSARRSDLVARAAEPSA